MLSECHGQQDLDQIMRCVSDDYLHQGMNKAVLEERLGQSYLLGHVDWIKITTLHFRRDANIAELAGFADSNLGVMPASEELLPLIEGSKLVHKSDGWKLLGNQTKSALGLYKTFHQLSAYFVPEDMSLYRSLLPTFFEMPPEPMVFVKVTDYSRVRLPLRPYKMAHIQILAEYEGLQGWYTLTMPETEWIPVEMGKTIGYPKYVADSILFGKTNRGWEADVVSEGENAISLSLRFEEDRSQASWFERMTSTPPMIFLRKSLPSSKEKPWFLTMAIESKDPKGTALLLRGDPVISGAPRIRETFGRVRLSIETNQPWAGLFPSEVTTRGVFMRLSGELILRHSSIAEVDGTLNSD
jgi:hypothetical protein